MHDCADFIVKAAFSDKANGEILNAGSGQKIQIQNLAEKIARRETEIRNIEHHHHFAEILSMRADSSKAKQVLGWKPKTSLEEGIRKTTNWLKNVE